MHRDSSGVIRIGPPPPEPDEEEQMLLRSLAGYGPVFPHIVLGQKRRLAAKHREGGGETGRAKRTLATHKLRQILRLDRRLCMTDPDTSRKVRAVIISRKVGLAWRTVYGKLPARQRHSKRS